MELTVKDCRTRIKRFETEAERYRKAAAFARTHDNADDAELYDEMAQIMSWHAQNFKHRIHQKTRFGLHLQTT